MADPATDTSTTRPPVLPSNFMPGPLGFASGLRSPSPSIPLDGANLSLGSSPLAVPNSSAATPTNTNPPNPAIKPTSWEGVRDWWVQNAHVPIQVAEGIADNVGRESSFRPDVIAQDSGGPSGGLYQAHGDRLAQLQQQQGWQNDPNIQHKWALQQLYGNDPISTQHRNEIFSAKTREEARDLFKRYFERPADSGPQAGLSGTTAGLLSSWQTAQAEKQKLIDADIAQIQALGKQIGALAPDSTERHRLLQEQLDRSHSLQEQLLSMARNPPQQKPTDLMSAFGSIAMLFAAIGGSRSRQPATASLNAAAGVIEGINSNNQQEYERNFKTWQAQTNILEKAIGMQNDDFRAVMDNERIDATERAEQINTLFHKYDMGHGVRMMQSGQIDQGFKLVEDMIQLEPQLQYQKKQMDELNTRIAKEQAETKNLEAGGPATPMVDEGRKDAKGNPTVYYQPKNGPPYTLETITLPTGEEQQIRKPYTPANPARVPAAGQASADPTAVENAAQMIANYQLAPMSGWAMRTGYGQSVMSRVRELNPKYSEPEYRARTAAETTVGRRGATLMLASNAADQLIPIVQELSAKVPRTNFPDINAILLAGRTKVGDPNAVAFGQALNSLLYVYMRALNPSGIPRVADLEKGEQILQTRWSEGQLDTALAQMKREIGAEKTSLRLSAEDVGSLFGTSDTPIQLTYKSADDVYKAFDAGSLDKDQAKQILIEQFGFKQ